VAFLGQLQLDNGGDLPLTNISVQLVIVEAGGDGSDATHLFSIGEPSPVFQGGASGEGRVPPKSSGVAAWLFAARREAAPEFETQYEVGGRLAYSVDGVEFAVPLFPDTISVVPSPILHVKYFWEQQVGNTGSNVASH